MSICRAVVQIGGKEAGREAKIKEEAMTAVLNELH